MSLTENLEEARSKFMDIVITIENTNKNDRMMASLVNKNKELINRRMLSSKFEELNINKDKLLYNNPLLNKQKSKNIKKSRASISESKKNYNFPFKRYQTESINNKYDNNILEEKNEKYEDKDNINDIKSINSIILAKDEENEEEKNENENADVKGGEKEIKKESKRQRKKTEIKEEKKHENGFYLNDKKLTKLDKLKTFLNLIETHKKTQYLIDLDPTRPKLDFIRNKKINLFKSSIIYDKNGIFYNKKYKLVLDQIKNEKNNNNKNFIINSAKNYLNTLSPNLSIKKNKNKNKNNKNRNQFLKKNKIYKVNSASYKLFNNNNNKNINIYKAKNNNIYIYNNKESPNQKIIRNNFYTLSDDNKHSNYLKTTNSINNNISNYINSSRPQTSITSKSNKTKIKLSPKNETIDIFETSTISLSDNININNINNLKNLNNSKKTSNFSKIQNFPINLSIKYRNDNAKILYEILSETLEKSQKIKKILEFNSLLKEKENEKMEEQKLKDLLKKKTTDIDLLVKELNLYYDEPKINLEELVVNNALSLRKHLQNDKQFRIMNKVANKVIVEDKILSNEEFIEDSVAKKLRKRIKTKSDKEFEFLIEKRKYLKNKMKKYKGKTETDFIRGLMKNDIFDFDNFKSLEEMIFKYRAMSHH